MQKYLKYKKKYLALKRGGAELLIVKRTQLFNKFIEKGTLTIDEIVELPDIIFNEFANRDKKGNITLKTLHEDDIKHIKELMESGMRLSSSWLRDSFIEKILSYKQAIALPVAEHHNVIEINDIRSIEDLRNLSSTFSNLRKITFNFFF